MTRKFFSFFYPSVLILLFVSACLPGCLNQTTHFNDTILTVNDTRVTVPVAKPVQHTITDEPAYVKERLSPAIQSDILASVDEIPYISKDNETRDLCIRSDPLTLVTIVLHDPNAQDMLMKSGHITGIGPYLPRSAKTNPDNGTCTAAVYISGRNITSGFVIDQDRQVVSRQILEVPSETHVRASGNRTIILINDSVVFVFDNQQYFFE